MALQAAPMAAMLAELMPWLIMRYLGEISYTEDRLRGGDGPGLAVLPRKAESNLCSIVCFPGYPPWAEDHSGGQFGGQNAASDGWPVLACASVSQSFGLVRLRTAVFGLADGGDGKEKVYGSIP
jgi:hypothetical protein